MRRQKPTGRHSLLVLLFFLSRILAFGIVSPISGYSEVNDFPLVTNVADFRHEITDNHGCVCRFKLEGVVLAADPDSGVICFHDGSGTEILETDWNGPPIQPGQNIILQGINYIFPTDIGLNLGCHPLVDNDGEHPPAESAGTVYLPPGQYPLRLLWFNHQWGSMLEASYSGPNFSRRTIPNTVLFRSAGTTGELVQGLSYKCFEGEWQKLPHFQMLTPARAGTCDGIDLGVETRSENVALAFDGFIKIKEAGLYTFYLRSDDGSQLYLSQMPMRITVNGVGAIPRPKTLAIRQPLPDETGAIWSEVEGQVTFVGKEKDKTQLEFTAEESHVRVMLCATDSESSETLLGSHVRVRGLCLDTRSPDAHRLATTLVVLDRKDVQVLNTGSEVIETISPANPSTNDEPVLTTAVQVQQLKREQALRRYPVKLQGVVTWVSENRDCMVLQDSTRGLFVGLQPAWIWDAPKVGEKLEIEGYSTIGDFSPFVVLTNAKRLGMGWLPSPLHPTWDQLIGGGMDSQFIEIRGLVTGIKDNHLRLLLPGGKLEVEFHPSVHLWESYVNSVVLIRGVMFAKWDYPTLQVTVNHPLWFGSAAICMESPPPADPFEADKMRAQELMQYDVQRNTFRRVKVSGQILHGNSSLYYLTDHGFGFRFQPVQPADFSVGDTLDVVGLVELGGPSPLIHEAVARKTGHLPLPPAKPFQLDKADSMKDSTRVSLEGLLVDIKNSGSDCVLEMQVGLKRFAARLPEESGRTKVPWLVGSLLRLTGTFSDLTSSSSSESTVNSFEILLNSASDVQLIARPPWWTLNRLLMIMALLLTVLALAFIWISQLRRQVERRTLQLKREIGERQKAEQARAIDLERSRIARDLHDDLGSQLTAISMMAINGVANKMPVETGTERLQLIADRARLVVTTLDGLVWTVNPKNDTLAALPDYVASFAEEFLARTGIACRIEIPLEFPELTVVAEARHNILLAVRESLNNAVRHSRATEILLQLAFSKGILEILIQDNGCGYDCVKTSAGNGLTNLQERMSKINGRCRIESAPEKGTKVYLTLPL